MPDTSRRAPFATMRDAGAAVSVGVATPVTSKWRHRALCMWRQRSKSPSPLFGKTPPSPGAKQNAELVVGKGGFGAKVRPLSQPFSGKDTAFDMGTAVPQSSSDGNISAEPSEQITQISRSMTGDYTRTNSGRDSSLVVDTDVRSLSPEQLNGKGTAIPYVTVMPPSIVNTNISAVPSHQSSKKLPSLDVPDDSRFSRLSCEISTPQCSESPERNWPSPPFSPRKNLSPEQNGKLPPDFAKRLSALYYPIGLKTTLPFCASCETLLLSLANEKICQSRVNEISQQPTQITPLPPYQNPFLVESSEQISPPRSERLLQQTQPSLPTTNPFSSSQPNSTSPPDYNLPHGQLSPSEPKPPSPAPKRSPQLSMVQRNMERMSPMGRRISQRSLPCLSPSLSTKSKSDTKHFEAPMGSNVSLDDRVRSNSCSVSGVRPVSMALSESEEDARAPLLSKEKRRRWLARRSPLQAFVRWRGRRVRPWPLDGRVQELDGGFFEKFGTSLKELAEADELRVKSPEGLPAEQNGGVEENGLGGGAPGSEDGDTDADAGVAVADFTPTEDSDGEVETPDASLLISDAMGWNIEELYLEVLYEILHTIGCDANAEKETLLAYTQEAFKLDDEKHAELLQRARAKEAPNILLNVEVVEAKELAPQDANGLSDPFCTLYLTSANTHRYNTSVKSGTLSPAWEEHFSLAVEDPSEDVLCVEVWDFDPAETVREKMMKIGEVKGMKGLRKLMREIAVTASTGKHDNEFIGSALLPLKSIPATGQTLWCNLEKRGKAKKQGTVKLRLAFSSEKNTQVAFQEHRHLVRLLLLHHIDHSKVEPYQWNGSFSDSAEKILTQHLVQCGLKRSDVVLAKWVEYSNVHVDHPLSFKVFSGLLEELAKPVSSGLFCDENEKMFWDAAKKLLPSCMNGIRRLRKLTANDKSTIQQLHALLSVLAHLKNLTPPENYELFPPALYGWLPPEDESLICDIVAVTKLAITQGAQDWYDHIIDNNIISDSETQETKLNQLIQIVQLVRTDLLKATEYYDKIFQQTVHLQYAQVLYEMYESRVADLVEPVVRDMCQSLKPLKFTNEFPTEINESDPLTMGTKLFELYLVLQRFAVLGTGLSGDASQYKISEFHLWFYRGVAQWLDIALWKALQRIQKAVELDEMTRVSDSVKHSSSAVDTLSIFYQIKTFWKQLAWPDVEGSYTFVAKIIDDICRCSMFYADKMSERVEGLGETHNVFEKKFEVTKEWCLAINNIEYVRGYIVPFVSELGMDDIVNDLANFRSSTAAEHCKQTLQLVIDNAVETVNNKIVELLETVAEKMTPPINRFLLEGAELLHQDNNHLDRLMKYLDDNLTTLHTDLDCENFDRILSIVWENLAKILSRGVENALEQRRPPVYFQNLQETLKILIGFFRQGGEHSDACNIEALKDVEELLALNSMETWQLIHKFQLERLAEQQEMEAAVLGLITVRAQFVEDMLRIQILNARNLHPMDSNGMLSSGSCDPYVKIYLLPSDKFIGVQKPRTKTHKKTLYPLFDETFSFILNSDQRSVKDGMVLLIIKDQDFIGNQFVAEAYIPFSDIQETEMTTGIEELDQIHIKLNKPKNLNSRIAKALDHRQGDKLAKDFMKKQRAKVNH